MEFVSRLQSLFAPLVQPKEEQLKNAMEALQVSIYELEPYILEPEELPYGRKVLLRTNDVEVVVIHLPGSAKSLPHDHGDSFGYEIVLEGELTNLIFQSENEEKLHLLEKEVCSVNSLVCVPKNQIHAIANAQQKRVVTLNVYSPPLSTCKQYHPFESAEEAHAGVIERKSHSN